ncbi:hypothetical protein QTP70_016064 [Hemibagrus guttatus]|uniref:Uncharacterized protein n=1 Tax=Hemibagrus guttatus TaxID=175788 RepID=A0AAE0QE39_9TELE|nr:hypothetical protein QTP70_016064 [Hemibagrus guttatus]
MERSQDEHTPTVAERKGGGRGGKGKSGRKGERGKENESLRAGRDEECHIFVNKYMAAPSQKKAATELSEEMWTKAEKPVPISGIIGHQGRIHPGQSANPSQGTHTHTTDYLEMPINLQCMSLDWGRKSPRNRENMQTPHTHGRGRNRTPNPGGVWQMC